MFEETKMKKSALLVIAAAFAVPAAWGTTYPAYGPSGAHYANGYAEPVCSVDQSTMSVSCTGTVIGGVGHTNAEGMLSASYSGTVQCRNHGGQVVEVKTQSTTGSSTGQLSSTKNGQLNVPPLGAAAPSEQTMTEKAKCPNGNWTKELVGGVTMTSYVYTLTFKGFTQPYISIAVTY
jgi:hypothetical protein